MRNKLIPDIVIALLHIIINKPIVCGKRLRNNLFNVSSAFSFFRKTILRGLLSNFEGNLHEKENPKKSAARRGSRLPLNCNIRGCHSGVTPAIRINMVSILNSQTASLKYAQLYVLYVYEAIS